MKLIKIYKRKVFIINKVILTNAFIGKKGIELRFTQGSGKSVATYSIAVPKEFSKEKEYEYFNIVTWGSQSEWLANNQDRIKKIGLIGRLSNRSYDAKDGTKKYIVEIITEKVEVEEWKNEGQQQISNENQQSEFTEVTDENSEIPF